MSQVLAKVFSEFIEREETGKKKYGTTMDRKDLSLDEWIEHMKQELMDAILYLEKIKHTIKSEKLYDTQRPTDYQETNPRNNESINTD